MKAARTEAGNAFIETGRERRATSGCDLFPLSDDDVERLRVAIYRVVGGDFEPTVAEARAIAEEVRSMHTNREG